VIRLARPHLTEADIAAVADALRSGNLVQGERVAEFERAIAERVGAPHVAAVCNGTAALQLALLALGVARGDRVAVAAYSWPATANAVVLCGAQPVFVDIERQTLGMDPDALDETLARDPEIRAVLPVHVFGQMARMVEILAVTRRHGAVVVEDAACALGAVRDGRAAGAWGELGCFSFHPRKAATTGEGGAVACTSPDHLRAVRVLRNHGQAPGVVPPDFVDAGFNMRLTEFQAALGLSQLRRYDDILAARRQLARRYDGLLAGLSVEPPREDAGGAHVYQSYVVLLDPSLAPRRPAIIAALRERGVETAIGTHHLPLLTYYRRTLGHAPGDHPVSEEVASRALALPLHVGLREVDQDLTVGALREVIAA
jgi:dTDP-4-amino-4,6-dideoxygalactose transaminase